MESTLQCLLEKIYTGAERQDVKRRGKEEGAFQTKPVSTPTQDLTLLRFDLLQFIKAVKIGMKICIPPVVE